MKHSEYLDLQQIRNEKIVKDRDKGKTFEEIANEYGISRQRIQQIYKRAKS